MDLKKAYNKIDNLCCLNHNTFQIVNEYFKQLFREGKLVRPIEVDFFEGYKYSEDDDFCKNANEMIDALEIIKNVVDTITQSLSVSLKYNVRVFHSNMLDEVYEFDTLQAARDYAAKQEDFCLISMALEEWFGGENGKQK